MDEQSAAAVPVRWAGHPVAVAATGPSPSRTRPSWSGSPGTGTPAGGPTPSSGWTSGGWRSGLADRGVTKGDKVLIHADNCPEMVVAWYACATLGAVGVTTNTRSVRAELEFFIAKTGCVGAVTQPQYAALVARGRPRLGWTVVTEDNSGDPAPAEQAGHGHDRFDSLYGRPTPWSSGTPTRWRRWASCSPRAPPRSPRRWSTPTPTPCGPGGSVRPTSPWGTTTSIWCSCPSSTSTPRAGRSGPRLGVGGPSCSSPSSRRRGSGRWCSSTGSPTSRSSPSSTTRWPASPSRSTR